MKKICPYHKLDILHITQWLNEWSSYGWSLKSWGLFFCEFQKYEGERFYYQLDADNWEDGPNEERKNQLKKLGWEYVETIGGTRVHIYRSYERKATIPLHEGFNEYNRKKYRFSLMAGILKILFILAGALVPLITQKQFWLINFMEKEKSVLWLLGIFVVALVMGFFHEDWNNHRFYKYLAKKAGSVTNSESDLNLELTKVRLPFGVLRMSLLLGALGFAIWLEYGNSKPYVKPFFAERHYAQVEYFSKALDEEFNVDGKYWMNVSENVREKLFEQMLERYVGYSNYFGYTSFKKEKYDTHDLWEVEELSDERFDRLVIADGRGKIMGDGLIFIQMEDDLVYLRYWGERDIESILEKVAELELR